MIDGLEDWATAEKTVCPECCKEVRALYISEHRWINHGTQEVRVLHISEHRRINHGTQEADR